MSCALMNNKQGGKDVDSSEAKVMSVVKTTRLGVHQTSLRHSDDFDVIAQQRETTKLGENLFPKPGLTRVCIATACDNYRNGHSQQDHNLPLMNSCVHQLDNDGGQR